MNPSEKTQLEAAIRSKMPLEDIVALLRRSKEAGVGQAEVYALLQSLHEGRADEAMDDRILEVSDFVAGFCSPHMRIWDAPLQH